MPKNADLRTQALLVVNSFKLHLNAFIYQTRGVFHVIYQTREGVFHLISKHREVIYQTQEGVFHLTSKHYK